MLNAIKVVKHDFAFQIGIFRTIRREGIKHEAGTDINMIFVSATIAVIY
jgi:hypothetical protein